MSEAFLSVGVSVLFQGGATANFTSLPFACIWLCQSCPEKVELQLRYSWARLNCSFCLPCLSFPSPVHFPAFLWCTLEQISLLKWFFQHTEKPPQAVIKNPGTIQVRHTGKKDKGEAFCPEKVWSWPLQCDAEILFRNTLKYGHVKYHRRHSWFYWQHFLANDGLKLKLDKNNMWLFIYCFSFYPLAS